MNIRLCVQEMLCFCFTAIALCSGFHDRCFWWNTWMMRGFAFLTIRKGIATFIIFLSCVPFSGRCCPIRSSIIHPLHSNSRFIHQHEMLQWNAECPIEYRLSWNHEFAVESSSTSAGQLDDILPTTSTGTTFVNLARSIGCHWWNRSWFRTNDDDQRRNIF